MGIVCQGILINHNILGVFGGLFSEDSGEFGGIGGMGSFSMIWQALSGVFDAHRGQRFLPPHISDLYDYK